MKIPHLLTKQKIDFSRDESRIKTENIRQLKHTLEYSIRRILDSRIMQSTLSTAKRAIEVQTRAIQERLSTQLSTWSIKLQLGKRTRIVRVRRKILN